MNNYPSVTSKSSLEGQNNFFQLSNSKYIPILSSRYLLCRPLDITLLPGSPHAHAEDQKVEEDDGAESTNINITKHSFHVES